MSLALPPAGRNRPTQVLSTGVLLAGVGVITFFGALIAAYINVRSVAATWPPKGVKIDSYLGAMLTITILMSSLFVEWAVSALRRGQQRQVLGALALTALLGLAFVNGVWYLGSQLKLAASAHPYATLTYALIGASGVAAVVGLGLLLSAMAKVSGRQVGARDPDTLRAVGWCWELVVLAWLAVYATLFLFK